MLETTIRRELWFWMESFVGVLGWADTWLPRWIYLSYWPLLILVALLDVEGRSPVRSSGRLVLLALAILCWAVAMLAGYVGWGPVAGDSVYGTQGRYFIPFAPLLFLPLHLGREPGLPDWIRRGVVAYCALVLATSLVTVGLRYYGG